MTDAVSLMNKKVFNIINETIVIAPIVLLFYEFSFTRNKKYQFENFV